MDDDALDDLFDWFCCDIISDMSFLHCDWMLVAIVDI